MNQCAWEVLGLGVTTLSCLASFFAVISLFRLKRTEIDLSLREERRNILDDLNQYVFTLVSSSPQFYFSKRIQEGAYEPLCLSEIYRFKIRSELAFKREDISKIEKVIIDPLIQITSNAFSLIKLRENESAYTYVPEDIIDKQKRREEKKKKFDEDINLAIDKENECFDQLDKMYSIIDEMKNKYCCIEQLYPYIFLIFFKKIKKYI